MTDFVNGATAMGCVVVAVFFWRYYALTRDRLFVFFSLAFAVFAVNRVLLAASGAEADPALYLVRLAAFLLIIVGIIDKNRAAA